MSPTSTSPSIENCNNSPRNFCALLQTTEITGLDIGSIDWWQTIERIGTPIVIDQCDGNAAVIFLWRQPKVNAPKAVYIAINGIIDHHKLNAAQFVQYQNSDVYYFIQIIPSYWAGSYSLIPVDKNGLQPTYYGTAQEVILQHREWLVARWKKHIADPLHLANLHACPWGITQSPLYLSKAQPPLAWRDFDQLHGQHTPKNKVEKHSIPSSGREISDGEKRDIWIYSTANDTAEDLPLVVLLDGQIWAKELPIFSALDVCTTQQWLPSAVYVMIDAVSQTQRGHDLCCNLNFWQHIQQSVLDELEDRFSLSQNPARRIVVGQSYGGLAAMYVATRMPKQFGAVVAQSGSFWWPDDNLVRLPENRAKIPPLPDVLAIEKDILSMPPNHAMNVFLEVGKCEGVMVSLTDRVADSLAANQHTVTKQYFYGGHDRLRWRSGIIEGLIWHLNRET